MNDSKISLLMNTLTEYYSNSKKESIINELKSIINQEHKISLRILDWFITNYSKKFRIYINNIDIYQDYKLQLKSYSKKCFDPFSRKNKIIFYFCENDINFIETSCGQLCFFKWCFERDILNYVKNNLEIIEHDMKTSLKHKKTLTTSKRQPLSLSASRSLSKKKETYILTF